MLTWNLKGKVHSRKHNRKEYVPSQRAGHECKSTAGDLQSSTRSRIALGVVPVRRGKTGESEDERGEDAEEDHVGSDGKEHVDEAQDTHCQKEE